VRGMAIRDIVILGRLEEANYGAQLRT
jgi:hypothetical protein